MPCASDLYAAGLDARHASGCLQVMSDAGKGSPAHVSKAIASIKDESAPWWRVRDPVWMKCAVVCYSVHQKLMSMCVRFLPCAVLFAYSESHWPQLSVNDNDALGQQQSSMQCVSCLRSCGLSGV